MSLENVREHLERLGLGERLIKRELTGATVSQAAIAIGCAPEHIAKTMSFVVNGNPILVVTAGDAKIDNRKYKDHFSEKAIMVPSDQVETLIGHAPGSVCPFGIHEKVQVFLDVSLKRFDTVYTAGGCTHHTVTLRLDELEAFSDHSGWVDVCKGWHLTEINS